MRRTLLVLVLALLALPAPAPAAGPTLCRRDAPRCCVAFELARWRHHLPFVPCRL